VEGRYSSALAGIGCDTHSGKCKWYLPHRLLVLYNLFQMSAGGKNRKEQTHPSHHIVHKRKPWELEVKYTLRLMMY
jgi:hypothetical protein